MKKTVAFILAFMYLSLTSGLAVNIHYCMGQVASLQINSSEDLSCKCGTKKNMSCCSHEQQVFKVNDTHQPASADVSIKAPEIILHTFSVLTAMLKLPQAQHQAQPALIPPLLSPPDIYIQNCTYRI